MVNRHQNRHQVTGLAEQTVNHRGSRPRCVRPAAACGGAVALPRGRETENPGWRYVVTEGRLSAQLPRDEETPRCRPQGQRACRPAGAGRPSQRRNPSGVVWSSPCAITCPRPSWITNTLALLGTSNPTIGGPSCSAQQMSRREPPPSPLRDEMATRPCRVESAPYLTALVASSCSVMPRTRTSSGQTKLPDRKSTRLNSSHLG